MLHFIIRWKRIIPRFQSPIFFLLAWPKFQRRDQIVQEAIVRLPAGPSFASGCLASSKSWYSRPIADPLFCQIRHKYFTPLLDLSVSRNSNCSSKALNSLSVTMSPPWADSLHRKEERRARHLWFPPFFRERSFVCTSPSIGSFAIPK